MKYLSKTICLGLVLISIACSALNPFHRDADTLQVGPDKWYSLVVYFKSGATKEQITSFNHDVLSIPRSDGRGEGFKEGIGEFLSLSRPYKAHELRGFAITFYKKATDEQRTAIIESIKSNELVYKVFENVAPSDIKESDLQ